MSSSSKAASSTVPIIASSSNSMSLPSHEMTGSDLFKFYMENFFKIPPDIKNDIIYCQRAMKAHIKVHQMVLDVYQQQPDADPEQKKLIVDELESQLYEINAEQNFLFLRLRRIKDEFLKLLMKNDIPIDADAIDTLISMELVPLINNTNIEILPNNVSFRNTEEKLIEKYFEVQKEHTTPELQFYDNVEIIDLDEEDDKAEEEKVIKAHGKQRGGNRKEQLVNASSSMNGESLLKSQMAQPSLLKPMNQRITNDRMSLDVQPKIIKPTTTLGDIYKQKKEEKEKAIELPVSTNVKMSRMNLRQALKRAQAAVRGPTANASIPTPPPPPPQPASTSSLSSSSVNLNNTEVVGKKSALTKTKNTRASVAAAAAVVSGSSRKSPGASSSSEGGTPERGNTPPHNYWPDEFEETRTKSEEYGQEMFLRLFDLFTPEIHAQLQQRRSKRRRRCVQNNNYHYGRIEHPTSSLYESDTKKKRKAFLLSPQVKKALPTKRNKRRSRDNASETNSVPPSRSNSSSPDEKRSCNECLKGRNNLEQCEECKFYYHPQCHREEDDQMIGDDPKKSLNEMKKCPGCKRKYDKTVKEEILLNKNLQRCVQELELQYAKEKDRHEILKRTSKSYKIQMNNLYEIVNSFKSESISPTSSTSIADNAAEHVICDNYDDDNDVIHLD